MGNMHKGFNPNNENKRKSERNETKKSHKNAEQDEITMKQRRKDETKENEMQIKLTQDQNSKLKIDAMESNQTDE